MVCTN